MKRFVFGFLTGGLVLALGIAGYFTLGLANVAADAHHSKWITQWMISSVHASIRRTAPRNLESPLPASEENLIAGGKLYLNDCVGCHGAPGQPRSAFGATFYPPAPQFALDGTTYSETQIYWVAKHGVRRTGMSAQGSSSSDEHLCLLAGFISRVRDLPPRVRSAIADGAPH